jgi:hypothetical protein
MPSDSLHDENYYANDNYGSDNPVSKHFRFSSMGIALVTRFKAVWSNLCFDLACGWPLIENQLGVSTAASRTALDSALQSIQKQWRALP